MENQYHYPPQTLLSPCPALHPSPILNLSPCNHGDLTQSLSPFVPFPNTFKNLIPCSYPNPHPCSGQFPTEQVPDMTAYMHITVHKKGENTLPNCHSIFR